MCISTSFAETLGLGKREPVSSWPYATERSGGLPHIFLCPISIEWYTAYEKMRK